MDEMKKREILAILAVGCTRQTAADYVGCHPSTIKRETERDEPFAAEIRRRETSAEIGFVRNIQDAAQKGQNWRAAAWLLERRYPDNFGPRKHGTITIVQASKLMKKLAQLVAEEVSVEKSRKMVLKRLQKMIGGFFGSLNEQIDALECGGAAKPANGRRKGRLAGQSKKETNSINAKDESHE